LLEKKKLPREKVCGAILMNELPRRLVNEEFGEMPPKVFADPPYYSGDSYVHLPGKDIKSSWQREMPSIYRINFDYWLNIKAVEKGVDIWDNTRISSIKEENGGYKLEADREGKKHTFKAKYIIGADGATSMVRRYLYPDFKPKFSQGYQEWYEGDIERLYNLDRKALHGFVLPDEDTRFLTPAGGVTQKGKHFVLEMDSKMGELDQAIARGKLALKSCGINLPKPVEKRAALLPGFYRKLFSGSFIPARGNILLIGDAAGLLIPVTGEGIGTAMKTGLSATEAIVKSLKFGNMADEYYLKDVDKLVGRFKLIYPMVNTVRQQSTKGTEAFIQAFDEMFKMIDKLF
jgi:flavin-dependent dehydrogenase